MRAVGTAEGVGRFAVKLVVYGLQVAFGHYNVGVKHDEILSLGAFRAVVAALPRTAVLFRVIVQVEASFVFCAYVLAWRGAAVFNYNYLKILYCLCGKAGQQFVNLVGAVVNGNDKRVFHRKKVLRI